VDRGYIEDAFNLYGLKEEVPNYNRAMALILDRSGMSVQLFGGLLLLLLCFCSMFALGR
jgi:hypothetical protein